MARDAMCAATTPEPVMFDIDDVRQETALRRAEGHPASDHFSRLELLRKQNGRAVRECVYVDPAELDGLPRAAAPEDALLLLHGAPAHIVRVAEGKMLGETVRQTANAAGITIREYHAALAWLRSELKAG